MQWSCSPAVRWWRLRSSEALACHCEVPPIDTVETFGSSSIGTNCGFFVGRPWPRDIHSHKCTASFGPSTDDRLRVYTRRPASVTFAMVTIVDYSIGSVHHARRRLKILGAGQEHHPCRHVPRHVNACGRQHGSL